MIKITAMRKLMLMFVMMVGFAVVGRAQKVPTADELAKKNVDEMEKRLKLTPTQKGIVYNYAYDFAKENVALYKKQQAGTFKPEDETKFFRMQADLNKNIKLVLKGDQVAEYDKLVEERLNGVTATKKKKKLKKGEEEEKTVGIEGLKGGSVN
jgi:protein CpxP